MKRKEHDLNQTSMIMFHIDLQGVFCFERFCFGVWKSDILFTVSVEGLLCLLGSNRESHKIVYHVCINEYVVSNHLYTYAHKFSIQTSV